jgi:ribokinase
MSQAKILVIGSYIAGLTMRTDNFPVEGQTVMGYDYVAMHGGKGSNQAVACARLGAEVAFAGCVGDDSFGKRAVELFETEGVEHTYTKICEGAATGVGFILINKEGENIITLDTAACKLMDSRYVDTLKDVIKEYDIILMQQEIPMEGVLRGAQLAKEAGKMVVLNPAPYCPIPDEVFPLLSVIVPNEGEARQMVGLNPDDESVPKEEVARRIREMGVENVVITLGKKGAYYCTANESGHLPARPVKAVDTTGAGDTFTASLTVALGEGKGFAEAIEFAQKAAAFSVCSYGVIESLPYRKDIY